MYASLKSNYKLEWVISIFCFYVVSCNTTNTSKQENGLENFKKIDVSVAVKIKNLNNTLSDSLHPSLPTKNPYSLQAFYAKNDFNPIWSHKGIFLEKADTFIKFINKDCKYYGLFPSSYASKKVNLLYNALRKPETSKTNSDDWANIDILLTDAFFQVAKHIKHGRLYNDTNYRYYDTLLHNQVFIPTINDYFGAKKLDEVIGALEPNFNEYDSLKIALRNVLNNEGKKYTYIKYPYTDSLQFIKSLATRIKEDNIAMQLSTIPDSIALHNAVKQWQQSFGLNASGNYDKDLIETMNNNGISKFNYAALSMDKLKKYKMKHSGDYVMVNIPAYYLRAYKNNKMEVESRVAVGKSATKTPEMESEISELILMPNWYVPPSILKQPGYIERKRRNRNYVVKGRTVMQKSGPGNALGEMKFNFKSGEAIYLHDTNEKWAFGSTRRAVSHGCVRVQQYKLLGNFIATVSPILEKQYEKVFDKIIIDSLKNDTITKYKYVAKDSTFFKGDSVITRLLKNKSHRELTVQKKVPIYIKYFTCAARNGNLVVYPDVYGFDKILMEKYFSVLVD